MPRNDNPFAPWNNPMYADDPFAAHNNPMYSDDPFKPWNSQFGSESDLNDIERETYRLPKRSRHDDNFDDDY